MIHVINYRDEKIKDDRTWGWFNSFKKAEDIVLKNQTDIFEYYYNYAVIEKVPEGVLQTNEQIQWYAVAYNKNYANEVIVTKIDCPDMFKNIFNFSIG